jgi:peptidoglycan/xylan/chitin deacetylase (PgdA/CDA1 family)/CelD/BcsL family acetyltransferase involved in cellulose biosynthesis
MRIAAVREESALAALKDAWNALLAESASASTFLTWEWTAAWWAAYGTPGELYLLLAHDDAGRLRGIAPLRRRTVARYGTSVPVLSFLCDGSADSDYLDFIAAAGWEAPVLEAFRRHWSADLSAGALLELNEIPESSPNFAILRSWGSGEQMLWTEADVPCSTVRLPGDWPAYLQGLAPRFRTKIRSVLRNLGERPGVTFHMCSRREELDRLLPCLYDLHRRRWATEAKPGVFGQQRKRRFYETLSLLLLERGWLRFFWMEWRGQVLACQYGFVYRDRYFQLQEGYEPACEHWNAGIGLRAWSIQELLKSGVREYDFMAGVGRHKSDWGAATTVSKRVVLGRALPGNVLACRAPEFVYRARQSVKALVPPSLLASRDAGQEQRRVAEFRRRTGVGGGSTPWLWQALANGYYHSPLPALLPALRDRYRLRVSSNGSGPRIGLDRRREPVLRIVYYHRVNDEGDAFFPAMPPAEFERQVRYIARHYPVVSLTAGLARLAAGGPPGPMVAITFDDGYQDNFHHAFPILERYGLKATIFLTTGGIDSRRPLWFEQLALALKRTPLPSLDLELDLPRRLWMRTEAERLASNDVVYTFLRGLSDAERRLRLAEILPRFEAPAGEERDGRMLTWDQVRQLKKAGIDFGAHTVSHPFVSRLTADEACAEICGSKSRIEAELDAPVEHFAYPSGREMDFAPWNKDVLRKAGFRSAVSTLWGVNYPSTDLMELRRGQPWTNHPAMFAARFDWYQWGDI